MAWNKQRVLCPFRMGAWQELNVSELWLEQLKEKRQGESVVMMLDRKYQNGCTLKAS